MWGTSTEAALLRVARMYVPSAAVAEEVVQETWIGVLKGIDRFEGRSVPGDLDLPHAHR